MRLTAYRVGCAVTAVTIACMAIAACIPHPKDDYDDFLERTANLKPDSSVPVVDASIDSKPPEQAVDGLYAGICVSALASGDPDQALRFYAETKFVPGTPAGKLVLTVTPLRGWNIDTNAFEPPAKVDRGHTIGATFSSPEVPVEANGRFTANLGKIHLEREANSISGRFAEIEDATLDGRFGDGDRFCSTLGGQLVTPYAYTFVAKDNICIFQKVKDGDPLPKLERGEFVCPL